METSSLILGFILGAIGLLTALLYYKLQRPVNYPPGPLGIPFIGNVWQIGPKSYLTFIKMAEKYGPIFSIRLGPYKAVVLNDYKAIKEALAEPGFSGRANNLKSVLDRCGGKPRGLAFNDGPGWVEQRRFSMKNLRDLGFGKKSMEELIHVEIDELIRRLLPDVGKPISITHTFNAAVLNGLWSIVAGQRYEHDDPQLVDIIELLISAMKQAPPFPLVSFIPLLGKILPDAASGKCETKNEKRAKMKAFMLDIIKQHKKTRNLDAPRDYIDVYLNEIGNTRDTSSMFYGAEGEHNLQVSLVDLFTTGAETTATTLAWAFLLLSIHPEVQEKLHAEIKAVVGLSQPPFFRDRPRMPYAEAVILEILRYSAIVPTALQHRTTEPTALRGFLIPADTLIIPNLYAVLRSARIWGDPDNFRPERFLSTSADGNTVTVLRNEALIPFSIGRRACPGETLARDQLFLFVTRLIQKLRVGTNWPGSPKPDPNECTSNLVLIPKPYVVVLHERAA